MSQRALSSLTPGRSTPLITAVVQSATYWTRAPGCERDAGRGLARDGTVSFVDCTSVDELFYVLRWRGGVAVVVVDADEAVRARLEVLEPHVPVTFASAGDGERLCTLFASNEAVRALPLIALPAAPDGFRGDIFSLGPLRVDRGARVAWVFGESVTKQMEGALFDVLLALCERWASSSAAEVLRADTYIQLADGRPHVFDYDDIKRLKQALGDPNPIATEHGQGYRLERLEMPRQVRRMTPRRVKAQR